MSASRRCPPAVNARCSCVEFKQTSPNEGPELNYFAHAIRHLDRPYFLAGLAAPDWLSVVDRKVRVRSRQLTPLLAELTDIDHEIAAGILQHLDDDHWFYGTAAFH